MATNFLDQLAETEVPPTPEHFDEGLHERLNEAMTTSHLATFVLRSVPFVLGHLLPAAMFLFHFTLTGELNRSPQQNGSDPKRSGGTDTSDNE